MGTTLIFGEKMAQEVHHHTQLPMCRGLPRPARCPLLTLLFPVVRLISNPATWLNVYHNKSLEWSFLSEPQIALNDRVLGLGFAKGTGGSAMHNAMGYGQTHGRRC
jgi:choline dehydrogenase-like flavoprotein